MKKADEFSEKQNDEKLINELKHLRELAESLDKTNFNIYQHVFEHGPDSIMVLDTNGIIQHCNIVAQKLLDFGFDDIIGKGFFEVLVNEEQGVIRDKISNLRSKGIMEFESGVPNKNGIITPVWVKMSGRYNKSGSFFGAIIHLRDITQMKGYSEALKESTERLELAVECASIGLWDYNFFSKKVIRNKKWAEMLGYTLAEIESTSEKWKSLIHPEDIDRVNRETKAHERGQSPFFKVEHRLRTRDNKWKWILNLGKVVERGENGTPIRALGSHVDISEQKEIQIKIKEEEQKFRGLFENIDHGIIVCKAVNKGEYFTVQDANQACLIMDKLSLEDVRNKDLDQVLKLIRSSEMYHSVIEVYLSGTPKKQPQIIYNENILVSYRDFFIYKLKTEQIVVVYSDLTDKRRIEEEKTKLEEELRQSQKMEAIGTLAGGIAHDFNNILGAIIGYTELSIDIFRDQIDDNHALNKIIKASDKAKAMIAHILKFSRKHEKEQKNANFGEVVEDAVKILMYTIPKTVRIQFNIEKPLPPIFGDVSQLQQIVVNICTNAAHAMQKTGGTLDISLTQILSDRLSKGGEMKQTFLLKIIDHGCGMSENIIKRMFEPYFTTKADGQGTGMGLAVVHGIIKSHNGEHQVISNPGVGTQFFVYLPVAQGDVVECRKKEASRKDFGDTKTVLFLDDEDSLVEIAKYILKKNGFHVKGFTDSQKALEFFKESGDEIDLIISDMTMPELTGIEFAVEARKYKDVPVILCTGYSERINEKNFKQFGINGFLLKPIKSENLLEEISKVFDLKEG